MGNLLFLIVPAALAAVAVTIVWLRNRPETSPTSGIDRFSEQMAALAPERVEDRVGVSVLTSADDEPAEPPGADAADAGADPVDGAGDEPAEGAGDEPADGAGDEPADGARDELAEPDDDEPAEPLGPADPGAADVDGVRDGAS